MKQGAKNARVVLVLIFCVVGMGGLAYASVPLYRKFCSATGFNGTTQRVAFNQTENAPPSTPQFDARQVAKPEVKERTITVTFDGNVDAALPWDFGPDVKSVTVKIGEVTNITYHAHNKGTQSVVGTATFNVQPDKIGEYFDKIQCFCFTKQVLQPGETISLPVQFYIDPEILKDHQSDDVQNITLSYTFFRDKDQRLAHAKPSP